MINPIDLIVFLVYMIAIVAFGSSFYFRNKDSEAYTSGGGRLPSWVVGMSIFATFVSSISFLAIPGKAYLSDWNAFVFSLSIPIASIMAVKFFVPLYRSINSISAYTYLERRFGLWASRYASICYILTQLMRTGSILYLLVLPLNLMFGWDIATLIIITGLAVIFYSLLGGIQAVIWTDAIQGIVLIGGALVCAALLLFGMPEGPSQLFEIGTQNEKFSLGAFDLNISESTFWVMIIYGLFINLQNYGIDQNYVQRYMSARSEKEAKSSALFGSLLYVPVSMVFFFIGTALYSYYSAQPDLLPEGTAADKVFPHFIVNALPTGITGLLIAAIFAAGMSTVSTSINSTATIILTDYYKRMNLKTSERSNMKVLYIASLVFGLLGIGVALAMINVKSALDAWWSLASIFSGGMLGLFLLGYFSKKAQNFQAAIAVCVGLLVILWMSLSPMIFTDGPMEYFKNPFHVNLTIVVGTTAIFLVGILLTVSRIGQDRQSIV
ncbi:sodium:solute symporter [Marinoscillum sp. MHG1-6]|uniref:sodium:solute symporter n=1 Tax=Marinoscillum sp. MHG1-6 TaxID=2959627 RepID=UPI0021572475|nr:sodium:solute symporter [Marinoscillum sp. MHG1-6]